ncbi:hypothetical protein K7432_011975 [Basidiobolus ranarum]|uniref:Lipase-like C-terminal domain-containing protein n=1 Tax=Basidiobolus ranarum TaxID=34480 RepID=A0ABR2WLK9_9FUNG
MSSYSETIPLVLVEGFLGFGSSNYWGSDLQKYGARKRQLIYLDLGCVSSLHDRVCELFYQLKGGRVDYGEEHSLKFGHQRFGKTYQGLYPQWSSTKPLHFLGHSFGGNTVWYLQHLLHQKVFVDHQDTQSDWVLSLTGISSPLRGTPLTHTVGRYGDEIGGVHTISPGSFMYRAILLYEWLDIKWLKERVFNFNLDHWPFTPSTGMSWIELVRHLMYGCDWAEGVDNAPYDLSVHSMETFNKIAKTHESTYYRTFAASMTYRPNWSSYHIPRFCINGALMISSALIGRFQNSNIEDMSSWRENDGVCPLISQVHPGECRIDFCEHHSGLNDRPRLPQAGVWQVNELNGCNHFSIIPSIYPSLLYSEVFKDYFNYLDQIDFLEQNSNLNSVSHRASTPKLNHAI